MDDRLIAQAIERAMEAEGFGDPEVRHDVAFHMTDWLSDLEKWYSFCESPDLFDSSTTMELLIQFLVHVPNHMAAASKLLINVPVSDVFGVGATTEDE